ncbi:MAG: tetraacyldisaccharide 4'-kinase [Burkholderiales bacterium]|nr:tetraacyldisaccharide 4'-kinase [Burkholderiales bacterium]GIK86444.1 MAG: tetraacyldisaccharide 4'-kinase [Betaproteobacteria bacterium]
MALRDALIASWYAPRATPLALALAPLGWVFRALVALRRALYRSGVLRARRVRVPVVVVGNITVGGAGKTPLVAALVRELAARGRRPGVVSRGYGGAVRGVREVRPGDAPALVGDEPLLLAAAGCPVVVGRERAAAAQALLDAHPGCDVVVCDDGLQHYALARDVEIVAIDARRGLGNGRLLPAGPLREPRSRLDEVDAIVRLVDGAGDAPRAGTNGRETTMTHVPAGLRNLADPARRVDPSDWRGARVHAVAGIAHPQRFFDLLARLGVQAVPHAFGDHHAFTPADLALPGADVIVMTAKDAVKCAGFADERCHALDIRACLDPALVALVMDRLDGRQAA